MAGGMNCESATCCTHESESERLLKRDGVLYVVCIECGTECEPVPEMGTSVPETGVMYPNWGTPAIPCGADVSIARPRSDNVSIPNRWGGPL